jgi:tRNA A37 threonylcarbamoyladenosine dehydratase
MTDTVGHSKAQLLADRVKAINPDCRVRVEQKFFTASTANEILSPGFNVVLDTIDRNENKTTLIGECVNRSIQVIAVGAGGDRLDASKVTVEDLARTIHDPLLQIVRKQLRQQYNFPKGERTKFHVACVYAPKQRGPRDAESDTVCAPNSEGRRSCNDGLGSAVYVTGVLGFLAAGEVINTLGREPDGVLYPWRR